MNGLRRIISAPICAVLTSLVSLTNTRAQEPPTAPIAPPVTAPTEVALPAQAAHVELYRIRVVNRRDGAIQVSTDAGKTWQLIGRVLIPAITVLEGYLASHYATPGTVAATAVHGIRIRTGGASAGLRGPFVLALEPKEYAQTAAKVTNKNGAKPNKGFGGYVAGAAGIFTDIPAGTGLFRELSPFTGNSVYLERESKLVALPTNFMPRAEGETLVIIAQAPASGLTAITFENKAGGLVQAEYEGGKTETLTYVVKPVQGIGRFDGTSHTGVGRINTAHTGVITVSTAPVDNALPEGEGRERRGGFQIEPHWHNGRTEEVGASMVMTVGTPGPRRREWEGIAPLFRDAINLADGGGASVEVQIDRRAWEPMPQAVGLRPFVFTGPGLTALFREQGKERTVTEGITAFRLRLPARSRENSALVASVVADRYRQARLAAAKAGKTPIVNGLVTVNANPTNAERVSFVRLSVEGTPRGFTNIAPFTLTWDTTKVPDGDYVIEAEALDDGGTVLATTRRRVFVLNHPAPAPVALGRAQ